MTTKSEFGRCLNSDVETHMRLRDGSTCQLSLPMSVFFTMLSSISYIYLRQPCRESFEKSEYIKSNLYVNWLDHILKYVSHDQNSGILFEWKETIFIGFFGNFTFFKRYCGMNKVCLI